MDVISEDKVFLLFDDITTMIIQIINYNHYDDEPFSIFSVFNEKNVTASFVSLIVYLSVTYQIQLNIQIYIKIKHI